MSEPAAPPRPPTKPPYDLPERALRGMVLTLSRPGEDEPESAWREVVQVALDRLGELDPRDPLEAMLAIQVIAAEAGALDAYRLAMEPGTTATQAQRQRASATAMVRVATGLMRALTRQRLVPPAPARDWGDAAAALAGAWQAAPARPAEVARGKGRSRAGGDHPLDRRDRRRGAGRGGRGGPAREGRRAAAAAQARAEGDLQVQARRLHPPLQAGRAGEAAVSGLGEHDDGRAAGVLRLHYDGPVAPLEMLTPASRAAGEAALAVEALLRDEYGM